MTHAVHVALGDSISRQGTDNARWLLETYKRYNTALFAGALIQDPCILLSPPSSPRALGDYCALDDHGLESRIRIRPSVLSKGNRFASDVLLHEMIHAWVHEVDVRPRDGKGYRGHGPVFADIANTIGEQLGLPQVHVRRAPRASAWPMCVRPADYYELRQATPRKKPPQSTAKKGNLDPMVSAWDSLCVLADAAPDTHTFEATVLAMVKDVKALKETEAKLQEASRKD